MADFKIPELGENVAGGDVTRVLVNVGDTIAKDQPVVELETDKATIEVPSSVAGVVKDIKVKKGDKVQVGAVVLTVDENGAGAAKPKQAAAEAPAPAPKPAAAAPPAVPPQEARAPQPKAQEQKPQEQPKPQEQKVVSMPQRTSAGAGRAEPAEARQPPEAPKSAEPPKSPAAGPLEVRAEYGGRPIAPAAPSVRRLAREIGVDVNQVQATGPGGRLTQEDVKEHARRILSSIGMRTPSTGQPPPAFQLPDFSKWGEVERQPMSNIRRTVAERLSYAWTTIPHVTQFDKADITAMEELRKQYREQVAKAGGNLTVTAMLVKVLATAVQKFPQFNTSVDMQSGEIIYKKYVNVGVAVDTDRGLLVPVVRNADKKNISQIAIEINQLAEKARDRKLTIEDMSGGGMTVSNLGGIGGTYFTPIVNWPEVAILGVSRGVSEPVWRGETFVPRQMLPLSLSYDHRVIDGADAMRFLRWVVEAIEQPFLLSHRLMAHETTQVAVLGAGPGGYAAAFYAADLGMQVALIDEETNPGGVCLYRGCIPSKALLHVAKVIDEAHHAEAWGVAFNEPKIDVNRLRAFKQGVVDKLTSGVGQVGRLRKVKYLQGRGSLTGPRSITVAGAKGTTELSFEHCILATGSHPTKIPTLSIDSPRMMDSTSGLDLPDIPKSLLVIGGGYIGLELGTVYAALGSKVSVVEMTPGLLPGADRDLVAVLHKRLETMFDDIMLNTKVVKVVEEKNGIRVTFEGEKAPKDQVFDRVLVAVGRRPNSKIPGLDSTKVKVDQKGFIETNGQRRTAEPSIFAIGDVAGEPMLAHKASHEARVAVEAIAGHKAVFEPLAIPAVVFTDPEIAWAGLTEAQAQAEGREIEVAKFPWGALSRAITVDRSDGLTKLVLEPKTGRILGVGIAGSGAGELIAEGALAIEMGTTAEDLKLTIHAHPTLSESLMEAAEVFFGQSTHVYKPKRK